jgi:osmoprotectant transport system substrate-binding protein
VIAALTSCSSNTAASRPVSASDDDAVTVGSFDFAESAVVAEVYSQGLEAAGFTVQRQFRLGPREFVGPALETGLVEFVPEYAGTAAAFYSMGTARPSDDTAVMHAELVKAVSADHVVALAASAAQDRNTFVVTQATASRLHLKSLSDLGAVADQLTFGGPPECQTRDLCVLGLKKTYHASFRDFVALDAGGALTHRALTEGLVDVAVLFTTDPEIKSEGLVELDDDKGMQPAESITPLVRKDLVDRLGSRFVDVIDAVSARLTTAEVRDLNGAVAAPGADVSAVATAWWAQVNA